MTDRKTPQRPDRASRDTPPPPVPPPPVPLCRYEELAMRENRARAAAARRKPESD